MALSADCKVSISGDNMTAFLYLVPPLPGESYTTQEVADFLRKNGVNYGIIFSNIESILKDGAYNYNIIVAQGTTASDGVDGYYEFLFDDEKKKKPIVRSDGSVDYQSMNVVHSVKRGEPLAQYHPAIRGVQGKDVRGREYRAHPGKELPSLKGAGFEVSYDGLTYTAAIEGKVEYSEYKLYVKDVFELKGDLDMVVGRIDFRGDVIIHGNVCTGTYIRATRSITVEGSVEAATLVAGGDIVLKKGIHGKKIAKVTSNGSVYAQFIEFSNIIARDNVEANIILNSEIEAGNSVIVTGKRGTIVGGRTKGVALVSANLIGNPVGMKTIVAAGAGPELERRNHLLRVKAETTREGIAKTLMEMQTMRSSVSSGANKVAAAAKISQLERRRSRDERLLEHVEEDLREIDAIARLASNARIEALNTIFTSSTVLIDDKEMLIDRDMIKCEFYRKNAMEDISIISR